jgi:hypothetical protein
MGTIRPAEALPAQHQELAQARHNNASHQFRSEIILNVEAEVVVEIDTEGGAGAGGSVGVVALKAGGKVSRAETYRLTGKLRIKDAATGGRNLEVRRDANRRWGQ